MESTPTVHRRMEKRASAAVSAEGTTSAVSSSSSSSTSYGNSWGSGDGGIRSSWITWCSLVIVAVVVVALLISRWFYIRRYYTPTLRAYFIPPKGLHIKWLRLHIDGPPARLPREPPPSYYQTTGVRRRRRHRQTVGDTLGAGGTRLGERDEDDMWDDEQSMAEMGQAGGVVRREQELLPQYYVDLGLPQYQSGDGTAAEEAERIRAITAAAGEAEAIPSAAEYEAASRAARAAAEGTAADGTATPTYPPVAHLAPSTALSPSASAAATNSTSRPSGPVRSSTARSANTFLSAALALPFLTRAPSPTPPSARHSASHEYPPRASTSQDTLDGEVDRRSIASDETAASHRRRPGGGVHRTSSSASGSSGGTKLGDDGESTGGTRRKKGGDENGPLTASSSRVGLDVEGEKAQEEKVEEVTKESQAASDAADGQHERR